MTNRFNHKITLSTLTLFCAALALLTLYICLEGYSRSSLAASPAEDMYHSNLRQQLSDSYGLNGGEWLFADSEQSNFDNLVIYGDMTRNWQTVVDQPFTRVLGLDQPDQPDRLWTKGIQLRNQKPIAEGDRILLTFWLRSLSAEVDTGLVRAVFEDRRDFQHAVMRFIAPSPEWQQHFLRAEALTSSGTEESHLSLTLGAMPQHIEIAGITAINYGSSVELAALPQSLPTDYIGHQTDAAWRADANARIRTHRQADLQVIVKDRNGNPLPDAQVGVHMQMHTFRFGTAASAPILLGTNEDAQIYRQKLTDLDGNGHGFNSALLEWSLQWQPWEGYSGERYSPVDAKAALAMLDEMGMHLRAHSLIWGEWRWMPPYMEENQEDPTYLLAQVERRLKTILNEPGVRGKVVEWDVVNEPRISDDLARKMAGADGFRTGAEINHHIFKRAHELDPTQRLFLNDYAILSNGGLDLGAQQNYHQIISELIDSGAPLDGIRLKATIKFPLSGPARVYAVLDDFAAYGKELHISEYDVEIEDETLAARYTRDFLTVIFSHPDVTGFTVWNYWDPIHWKKNSAFFRRDWSMKPAGTEILDLLYNEWWTDEEGTTNAAGHYATRAFLGHYQIEARYGDVTQQMTTTIVAGTNSVELTLDVNGASAEAVVLSLSATPEVDGVMDSVWNQVTAYPLTKVNLGDAVPAADLSAEYRIMAHNCRFYLLMTVVDNDQSVDSGEEWWEDDAVEIFLDGDDSRGARYDGVNDAQFVFNWNAEEPLSGPNSVAPPSNSSHAWANREDGYTLELSLPFSALELPTSDDSTFGLDVQVIDDDGGGPRERKLAWHAESDETWRNPALFGTARISGQPCATPQSQTTAFNFLPITVR